FTGGTPVGAWKGQVRATPDSPFWTIPTRTLPSRPRGGKDGEVDLHPGVRRPAGVAPGGPGRGRADAGRTGRQARAEPVVRSEGGGRGPAARPDPAPDHPGGPGDDPAGVRRGTRRPVGGEAEKGEVTQFR